MRNYEHIDRYLNDLLGDLYPAPSDPQHTEWRQWVMDHWLSKLTHLKTVLDIGCGDGFVKPMVERLGFVYTGVTIGKEYLDCKEKGLDVHNADMNFLPFGNNSFDILLAFHVLEHSFSPLISLMHWREISREFLCVVLPNPEHFTFYGINHYHVMIPEQFRRLCKRAGWNPVWESITKHELRYMCQKCEPDIH